MLVQKSKEVKKERDYEIIDYEFNEWEPNYDKCHTIKSVRRLSDNEVFTIGDIIWSKVNVPQNYRPIKDIKLVNNEIYVDRCPLKNAVKSKVKVRLSNNDTITVEEYFSIIKSDWEDGYKKLKDILKNKNGR